MNKGAEKESLMNTLARNVGRVAGTIAKATQGLAANAATVETDKARRQQTQKSKSRSTPKKNIRAVKHSTTRSRKRGSRRTD